MEDMERYSDYNEYEDDIPKGKSPVGLILKILVGIVCVSVIGILAFRLILFNSYPDNIKNIYFNDKLTAYYNEKNGDIGALTQVMRAPYDDEDKGNFFCDNLIVIRDIDQLQVSVRFNESMKENIKNEYGVDINIDDPDIFSFSLTLSPKKADSDKADAAIPMGTVSVPHTESKLMYRYFKLVFDDVIFESEVESYDEYWIWLEIKIDGVEPKEPFRVLIYEESENYGNFKPYDLSSKEKP